MRAFARLSLTGLCVVLGAAEADSQKTDSVWIRNGDRITGEVKSLLRARLKYSTDDLGEIYIEWDKVDRISSPATYEVELSTGQKYYGSLGLGPRGSLVLGADTLLLAGIVALAPIKRGLLARVDGYLDVGFSYQQAHKTIQLTSGAKAVYRAPKHETTIQFSTFFEDRDDAEETGRLSVGLTQRFLRANRWSIGGILGFDRNEELDLEGRGRVVGFGARTLTKNNHVELWTAGGLVMTLEQYFSNDSTNTGFEGYFGAAFTAFRYDRPKLDASFTTQIFPSLSVQGRVRLENGVRVSYELVKDFMLTFTLFHSFDNKPPSPDAPKNDFGTTLAISFTF